MGAAFAQQQFGGHEILNHIGNRIRITERTLDALDVRGYLHRDKATGLKAFSTKSYLVFAEAERATDWYYELGEDCSGPNQVVCRCEACKRLNPNRDPDLGARVVAQVRAKRA